MGFLIFLGVRYFIGFAVSSFSFALNFAYVSILSTNRLSPSAICNALTSFNRHRFAYVNYVFDHREFLDGADWSLITQFMTPPVLIEAL